MYYELTCFFFSFSLGLEPKILADPQSKQKKIFYNKLVYFTKSNINWNSLISFLNMYVFYNAFYAKNNKITCQTYNISSILVFYKFQFPNLMKHLSFFVKSNFVMCEFLHKLKIKCN